MKKKLSNNISSQLNFDICSKDLYSQDGLKKINNIFEDFLKKQDPEIAYKFFQFKNIKDNYPQKVDVIIEVAKILELFLAELFLITKENNQLQKTHQNFDIIYHIKRNFIQREVAKEFKESPENYNGFDFLIKHKIDGSIDQIELKIANIINENKINIDELKKYCRWALYDKDGQNFHDKGALFKLPQKIDYNNLIQKNNIKTKIEAKDRGFNLTDEGFELNRSLGEANYCIFCHKQQKDSCRKGLHESNQNSNNNQEKQYKTNPLDIELKGCPLDEKISEMNLLKSQGFTIAALAVAIIDNPMIAGTGHRICNDCMKSCIYQKQDPVDIPQIETRILKDSLSLPYGFEIYSLLTKWNPLHIENKLPHNLTKKRVLVCGLGPAGYTLSHYLINAGHDVIAIDGLKIEPLDPQICGIDYEKKRCEFKLIKNIDEIYENLSTRELNGFGGVAEYGITVRWNKNFLKIIRLILERRINFQMFGGIRFGSSIDDITAFNDYGFDHIALCIGAGKPKIIDIENNFAKGIRLASDFLMSLQLTGAFKEELFTNLQIRLPIIVIGGGLTAVDTACEAQAYYFIQIKKFNERLNIIGKEKIWPLLNEEEKIIANEFIRDYELLKDNNAKFPNAKILYRKKIQNSPSYKLNHEELKKALEQGVEFIEEKAPKKAILDDFGNIKALECVDGSIFECKSLLIAAGTNANISPASEDHLNLELNNNFFNIKKDQNFSFITKINDKNQAISFFGDLHPQYEGNVVKAMASAKYGFFEIENILKKINSTTKPNLEIIQDEFTAKINKIERLSESVIEVTVKAPLIAKKTQVGQIFRLQNYHKFAPTVLNQKIAMEGIAITALNINKEQGLISGIVVETGGSTSLIKNFKIDEPCVFMGPSGKPTDIPQNETVVIIGGGRGNQPLTALAEAFTANNCKVLFFAGYRKNSYIVRQKRMENSCYKIIYSIEDELPNIAQFKNSTEQFHGNVIESIKYFFSKNKDLTIDRIFTIGNNYLMHNVAKLRHEKIIPEFANAKYAIASLNSPMQCMMKGVCAQCLQKRINPDGEVEYFYSCADQDQNMDKFNFQHLHYRCEQNSLSEKISKLWIEYLQQI